jgi:PKD repeat protein
MPTVASFNHIVQPGKTPSISFIDTSLFSEYIVSWAWDFNNDGLVDSTLQHPSYAYPSRGAFTAKLTVTDIYGATSTAINNIIFDEDGDGISDDEDICPTEGAGDICIVNHCVTNSSDLQGALTEAQGNNKTDVIKLVQGTYSISENGGYGFSYSSNEPYSVYIEGGYTAGCSSRDLNPSTTILDGGNYIKDTLALVDDSASLFVRLSVAGSR